MHLINRTMLLCKTLKLKSKNYTHFFLVIYKDLFQHFKCIFYEEVFHFFSYKHTVKKIYNFLCNKILQTEKMLISKIYHNLGS